MVSCGWRPDGSVMGSFNTSGICDYGACHVVKRSMNCADGSSMTLSGCCKGGYGVRCSGNIHKALISSEPVESCSTKKTRKLGNLHQKGTKTQDDDVVDGVLVLENVRRYETCEALATTDYLNFRMLQSSGSGGSGGTTTAAPSNVSVTKSGSHIEAEVAGAFCPSLGSVLVAHLLALM